MTHGGDNAQANAQFGLSGTCPNCGYCPHCGRSAAPVYPFQPFSPYRGPWWGIVPPYYNSPSTTELKIGDPTTYGASTSTFTIAELVKR